MTSPPLVEGQGWLIGATVANRPKAAIATMQYDTRLPVDHKS